MEITEESWLKEYAVSTDCHSCDRSCQTCPSWHQLIHTVALRIRRCVELPDILQATVNEVQQLLGCDRTSIYRFAPDWSGRVAVEAIAAPHWSVLDRVVHDPCFEASWLEPYQEKRYSAIEDVTTANISPCQAELLESFQVRANLVVPLLNGDALWGLLIAHHCQGPRPWQAIEIEGLQLLAVQVGIAIHQASLIEQLQASKATLKSQVAHRARQLEAANQRLAEKVRQHKQIATERQQLATIVESSQVAIISKTTDGITTSWNPAAETLFGYTASEMIDQPMARLVPEERQDEASDILKRICRGEQIDTYETQRLHKNGQIVDVAITSSPICALDGQVIGASQMVRDISPHKRSERLRQQAEQALRDNQERFQNFMDHAPLLSWIVSQEGQIKYGNRAWFDFIGEPQTTGLGRFLADLFPPDLAATYHQNNQQVLQSRQVIETVEEAVTVDGELKSFLVSKFPVYENGQVAVGGIAIDITQQKQTEALVREQAETLSIFYESSPLMMGLVEISDRDILHLSDNPATLAFFAQSPETLTHRWATEVGVSQDMIDLWLKHYRQSQAEQRPIHFNYRHVAQGQEFWLLVTVSLVGQGSSGRPRFSYIVQDLTPIKQLESEKQEVFSRWQDSEQRHASLIEAVPVGIFRSNAAGECIYVNPLWEQLTGITYSQALGQGWLQAIYPDDRGRVEAAWTEAIQSQRRFELEYRLQSTTGEIAWVYGQAVASYSVNGDLLGHVGTITDITDRKQIETERQRAEQIRSELSLLEQVLDVVLAGYWDWNIPAHEEYLSPGFKRMFGYEDHELPNTPDAWQQIIFPEDLAKVQDCLERHVQSRGQEPFYNEVRYRHKDGSTVWVICSGQAIEWSDDGQPVRMIGCHIDISDRKRAELEVKSTKEQLELVLQASSEGFWDWDFTTDDIYFSPRWKSMLGYADHELDNSFEMWKSVLFEEDRTAALQLVEDYNSGRVDQFVAIQRFRHKNGSTVYVLSRAIHLKDERGQVIRMVGSHLDITHTKLQEIALQESKARYRTSEMQLSGILNSSLDGIMAFRAVRDDQGHITDFEWILSNSTACEMVSQSKDQLIGQRLLEKMPGNRDEGLFDLYVQVVESGEPARRQFHYQHEGIDCWFETIVVKLGDGFAVTFRDITATKQSEQKFQQVNQQLEIHVEDLQQRNAEMLMLSKTSDFLQACRSIAEACAVISTLVQPLFPTCGGSIYITKPSHNRLEQVATWGHIPSTQLDFAPYDCWGLRRGRLHLVKPETAGLRCAHSHTVPTRAETLCIPMIAQGETLGLFYLQTENGQPLSTTQQQLAQTVAEQIGLAIANLHLRETLQSQSIRDALTGLFNRRYLEEALQREIARAQRHQYEMGVIMLDVDHFKHFNDTYGHEAGDLVLQAIGKLLRQQVRSSDLACRYGGEELTLILPESTLLETQARANEIRQAISQLQVFLRGTLLSPVTASLGVAGFPYHGKDGPILLQAADAVLYRAKAGGRNRVMVVGGQD